MTLLNNFKEELKLFWYDKWLLASVSIIPIVLFVLAANLFSDGILRKIPIAIVDLDDSKISRQLTRYYDASPSLSVSNKYINTQEAIKDLRNGILFAVLVINPNMQENITKEQKATIDAHYNTQYLLVGRSIHSTLLTVLANFNAKLAVRKTMKKGNIKISQAIKYSVPISQQLTPLYNFNLNYANFLIVAIFPCIWQILLVSSMILNLVAQERKTGLMRWVKDQGFKGFFAKMLIHQATMLVLLIVFLIYFYEYLNWSMEGSFIWLIFIGYLTILASQAMACLFFFTTFDAPRALSAAAAYTAPSLAFLGVTFPYTDMSVFAKIWHSLLPISHYFKVQISQANYGANISLDFEQMYALLAFNFVFLIILLIINLKKEPRKVIT